MFPLGESALEERALTRALGATSPAKQAGEVQQSAQLERRPQRYFFNSAAASSGVRFKLNGETKRPSRSIR
ncbi:hypothetical protein ACVIU7_008547 [Bradyrhizobium liaoningense]